MKKIEDFILSILQKVEGMQDGLIAYAYKNRSWWEISVSDFDFYMNNQRFKKLSDAWHKAAKAQGETIVFVCGWIPTEEKLEGLLKSDNLILNV